MAPSPLFVSNLESLQKQLRLSGIVEGTDAFAMLEAALLQARAGFYTRLGDARVAALVAITPVSAPATKNQILRSVAEMCEALWVRCILLDRLPVLFMDAAGGDQEFINQEGTFRSISPERLNQERSRNLEQIEEWLALLAGDLDLGDAPAVQITQQTGQLPRIYPFGSLLGENKRIFGDPTRDLS